MILKLYNSDFSSLVRPLFYQELLAIDVSTPENQVK